MSNTLPKVSIVTPSFNQGEYIEKTILSVLCQDYPNIQYIVVDGASEDRTGEVLRQYQASIDRVIVEPDDGQSHALQKGFALCAGDILTYINSDDCYANAGVVSRAVKYLTSDEGWDVVYGRRIFIDRLGMFYLLQPFRAFSEPDLYLSDYVPQECVFFTRRIFSRAGNRIDRTYDFAMDYELWLRFLKSGAKFLSVRDPFGLFRCHAAQKTTREWGSKGLVEIARLQREYLHREISEAEMVDYNFEYFFGAHPRRNKKAFQFAKEIWDLFVEHRKRTLAGAKLDTWMFADLWRLGSREGRL